MIIALKKIMEEKKITAPELAEKTGLTKAQIWNYQSGRNDPDPETLCVLADALDVSLDMLVRGKEKALSVERAKAFLIGQIKDADYDTLHQMMLLSAYWQDKKVREEHPGEA